MKFKVLLATILTVIATATPARSESQKKLVRYINQVNTAPNMALRIQGYTLALDYFKDLTTRMVQADKISYKEGLEAFLILEEQENIVVDACFGSAAIDKCTELMNSSISGYAKTYSRELQKNNLKKFLNN